MKLLNKVGDAMLAKLVPGIDAKAGCGRCTPTGGRFICHPRCCRNGRIDYAAPSYDQCGNLCAYRCTVLGGCGRC
jgi:hypothetical protein